MPVLNPKLSIRCLSTIEKTVAGLNDDHTAFLGCLTPVFYLTMPVVATVEQGQPVVRVMDVSGESGGCRCKEIGNGVHCGKRQSLP